MKNARIILILGIWVAVLPYLGFPYSSKKVIFSVSGLLIMYMAYVLYKKYKQEHPEIKKKPTFDNFSENSDFSNPNV